MKRLLKVPEAASRLNLSVKTTWKMVYGRKFDVVRIGRSVRIPEESLDKWKQVDFEKRIIAVGRSKTKGGEGRVIPLNDEAFEILVE